MVINSKKYWIKYSKIRILKKMKYENEKIKKEKEFRIKRLF